MASTRRFRQFTFIEFPRLNRDDNRSMHYQECNWKIFTVRTFKYYIGNEWMNGDTLSNSSNRLRFGIRFEFEIGKMGKISNLHLIRARCYANWKLGANLRSPRPKTEDRQQSPHCMAPRWKSFRRKAPPSDVEPPKLICFPMFLCISWWLSSMFRSPHTYGSLPRPQLSLRAA